MISKLSCNCTYLFFNSYVGSCEILLYITICSHITFIRVNLMIQFNGDLHIHAYISKIVTYWFEKALEC